jgi:hypothetical protein
MRVILLHHIYDNMKQHQLMKDFEQKNGFVEKIGILYRKYTCAELLQRFWWKLLLKLSGCI